MHYKLVFSIKPEELEKEVNSHLSHGYKPLGGVQISINDNTVRFAQSLVKED